MNGTHSNATIVEIYRRRSCGICDLAVEIATRELLPAIRAGNVRLNVVDIGIDRALAQRFDVLVPVVRVNGDEVAIMGLSEGVLADIVKDRNLA